MPKDEYFPLTRTDKTLPKQLLRNFENIPSDATGDLFGQIYEYFIAEFARSEGQKGGEFFTPRSVVRLMVETIEPHGGRCSIRPAVPAECLCSRQSLLKSIDRISRTAQRAVSMSTEEKVQDTINLAKMNLAVNGLRGDIKKAISYYEDPFGSFGAFD